MFALEHETGNQKWRYPLVDPVPGYFRSAPVYVEGQSPLQPTTS
jgi:hypothetical protein